MYFSCEICFNCSHKFYLPLVHISLLFCHYKPSLTKTKDIFLDFSPIFQTDPTHPPGLLACHSPRDLMLGGLLLGGLLLGGLLLPSGLLAGDSRRRILHSPGDFILGGLFPMHEQVKLGWEWKKVVRVNIQEYDLDKFMRNCLNSKSLTPVSTSEIKNFKLPKCMRQRLPLG